MKLTIDSDIFLLSHFTIGIVLLGGFYFYRHKTYHTLRVSDESWLEFLTTSVFLGLGGYAALALIIFGAVLTLVLGTLIFAWHLLLQLPQYLVFIRFKLLEWSIYIVLMLATVTQCTSKRVGAFCGDGTYSYATGRGACSWHDGVSSWDREYWWDWFDN